MVQRTKWRRWRIDPMRGRGHPGARSGRTGMSPQPIRLCTPPGKLRSILRNRTRRKSLQPRGDAAMVRAGSAVVLAEAVGSIDAPRCCAGRDVVGVTGPTPGHPSSSRKDGRRRVRNVRFYPLMNRYSGSARWAIKASAWRTANLRSFADKAWPAATSLANQRPCSVSDCDASASSRSFGVRLSTEQMRSSVARSGSRAPRT